MAYQTGDGRWIVGLGVEGESSYNGFAGWRDCVIQLTADGATEQSVKYLEGLRDYAIAHSALGESIMPPSVNVWVSNNGTTTAVQADDLAVDGETFTICGIKWDGSAWDYTNAGKGSGAGGSGGSGGNVVVAHVEYDMTDPSLTPGSPQDVEIDKTYAELTGADLSYVKLKAFEGETPVQTFFLPPVAETHGGYLVISYGYEESGYAYSVNVTEEGAKLTITEPS